MGRDNKKGRGGGRGSGRRIEVANEEELALRELQIEQHKESRAKRRAEEDDGGDKKLAVVEEEQDDDDDEEEKPVKSVLKPNNPNFMKKPIVSDDPEAGLNRKQREILEQQRNKEEYMKRHLAGQTEEARKDLERLALVRKRREDAAKKREAEGRAPGMSAHGLQSDEEDEDDDDNDDSDDNDDNNATSKPVAKPTVVPSSAPVLTEIQAKKKAAALETSKVGEPEKLKAMDIKKMNGDALKDALRERNLDLQGQKKDLMKRLLDYEATRS